ncbi:hypothetical protein [Mangrovicoccus ximenensis]|uniref:hypothetical protein n=1 Tax=Mangrovicoccus ximenensis TaxID=1911570 RepID=UPI000D3A7DFC|nr:hypothetical protein [Mangrovicoccus ximenensis]
MNVFPFSAIFRAPLSGDVAQSIAPDFAGVPEVERRITEEVASYGSQLGTLFDALKALADRDPDLRREPEMAKALELRDRIEAAKAAEAASIRDRAERLMDSLHALAPELHAELMARESRR